MFLAFPPRSAAHHFSPKGRASTSKLQAERDDLRKKLDAAQKALAARKGSSANAEIAELTRQLDIARTRLSLYETRAGRTVEHSATQP